MAERHNITRAPNGPTHPQLVLSFLDVASSAARKARRHAATDELGRLVAEVQDRLQKATALARQSAPPRRPRPRRST